MFHSSHLKSVWEDYAASCVVAMIIMTPSPFLHFNCASRLLLLHMSNTFSSSFSCAVSIVRGQSKRAWYLAKNNSTGMDKTARTTATHTQDYNPSRLFLLAQPALIPALTTGTCLLLPCMRAGLESRQRRLCIFRRSCSASPSSSLSSVIAALKTRSFAKMPRVVESY